MKYKLTLTNEKGEVAGWWAVETEQTIDPEENDSFRVDVSYSYADLCEEIAQDIDRDHEQEQEQAKLDAKEEADMIAEEKKIQDEVDAEDQE